MRPLVSLALATLSGAALAPAIASAVPSAPGEPVPRDAAAARTVARQHAALDLLNQATSDVRTSRKTCRPDFSAFDSRQPPLTTSPDPAILAQLAPLRRPATPADLAALGSGEDAIGSHGPGAVYSNFVRRVTAANGRELIIVVARQTPPAKRPASCLRAETTRLDHLLVGQPTGIAATARRYLRHSHRSEQHQSVQPFDGVFTYSFGPDGSGGGGGGGDAVRFARFGNLGSSGRGKASEVSGLVPDGVAAIRFDYPKRQDRGRLYEPVVYPSAIHRTVQVHDNAVDFNIHRTAEGALPSRMTWLAADGRVLRVVRP